MRHLLYHIIPALDGMNALTLKFKSPELEERFRVDYANRSLPIARLAMLAGGFQYLLFYVLDLLVAPLITPGGLQQLLAIRVIVFLYIIVVLAWSYTDYFKKHHQFGISTVPIVAGLGVISMVYLVQNSSGYDQYHVGIMIIFFYIHVLLRLRFVYATVVGWLIFWMYFGAAYPTDSSGLMLINNSFFLVATQLCGMIASYSLEYYARTVFRQRRDLEYRRREITSEHNTKAAELNSIRDIQLSLIPEKPPVHADYEIAGSMKTATEIGGDFYDFSVSKNGTLTFAIGDATGHGAKASALVTATKILFVSMANRKNLANVLKQASAIMRTTGLKMLYMSLALGRLSGATLELAGAGMPPAYIWRNARKELDKIPLNGMPLGASANYRYSVTTVPFSSGDILFMMSDGLPELFNAQGQMYGYEKAQNLIQEFSHLNPSDIVAAVESEIANYMGEETLRDDVSVIAIKKK